jgi:hypothetical protein
VKIPPLPKAAGRKKQKPEPELVPGSLDFRRHLESLAGLLPDQSAPEIEDELEEELLGKEDAPRVKIRNGKTREKKSSRIFFDPEAILARLEAEEVLDSIGSGTDLSNEPSILDLYRQRLVEHYGFATDDPVFALCEIFDEVRKRDLERSSASEVFCSTLMDRAEQALTGLTERSAALESRVKEQQALESRIGGLDKLVERIEEIVLGTKEELAARGASLSLVQRELEREVQQALQRGMVERLLMSVILVAVLAIGLFAGAHWRF